MYDDLKKYLPQTQPMQLIDSISEVNEHSAICTTTIVSENIFYDSQIKGISSWVGIEMMAQTMAVFASAQSDQEKAPLGFLMSVRKFPCLSEKRTYYQINML